jgi:hypothetical protein
VLHTFQQLCKLLAGKHRRARQLNSQLAEAAQHAQLFNSTEPQRAVYPRHQALQLLQRC